MSTTTPYLLGMPATVTYLAQQGLLDRAFWEPMFPALQYRKEAEQEEWPANTGTQIFMTRQGLLAPATQPLTPGVDPQPKSLSYEQWSATLGQYGDTIDTYMPNATVQIANTFLANVKALGLQAGQTLNRLARNALFKAYLSGHTLLIAAALAGDTTIQVASLNGFQDVVILGQNVAPAPVSPQTPLPIQIGTGATAIVRNVVGFQPLDPNVPDGPGTLFLDAAVGGAGAAYRTVVLSSARPRLIYSGGGSSVDSLSAGDLLSLQDIINAAALLRQQNVPPHDDGFYHAHIDALGNAQVFADPVFQRLNQSLPDGVRYAQGFIGHMSGVMFFMNTESPVSTNVGTLVQTGNIGLGTGLAMLGTDIGSEIINDAGINVGNVLITGKGAIYERYLDESNFVTEAGVTGKIGEFSVVNNGIAIETDKVRLVIRAPIDRLMQKVSASWSISTSFPVPTDITAQNGSQRFRRALVLRFALGSISA